MKPFYFYQASLSEDKSNFIVCFYSGRDLCFETFCNEVATQFESSIFTRSIVFITPSFNKADITTKLLDSNAQLFLKNRINSLQEFDFHSCFVNRDGSFEVDILNKDMVKLTTIELQKLLEVGLFGIIKNRNLIVEADANIHFVKPSGKHTSKFIDVKNILESSSEISFIAINLLKFLPEKITRIYIDTSGIYALAYEISNIIRTFDSHHELIMIDSFGSYGRLNDYEFNSDAGTVVLISASTSNGLYNELKSDPALDQASFISIIMNQLNSGSQKVLIDFESYRKNFDASYFAYFESYPEEQCPMCLEHYSVPVALDKSRFDFGAPRTELYLPVNRDSDSNLKSLIHKYKDLDAFRCLFDGVNGKKNPTPEYFIDVSKVIQQQKFQDQVVKLINRFFPLNTSCIIHCKDQGAHELAVFIKEKVSTLDLTLDLYDGDIPVEITPEKGIVVVAGSLESGKSLLNISRSLRRFHNNPITYIIGFAKYNSEEEFDKLQRDLKFSQGKSGHHEIHVIEKILLPINEHKESCWEKELRLLTNLSEFYKDEPELKETIETRIQLLREASSEEKKGLGELLFNPSPTGASLVLGPSFAFWDKDDSNSSFSHHAPVYFTISSILQGLRTKKNNDGIKPLGQGYIIRQLDPLLFDRFNEGIIQASILRTAKPTELNYSADDARSRVIGSLIERMLKYPEHAESSGLSEFLLALCTKSLQIKKDHLQCLNKHSLNKENHPLAWIFATYAKKQLLENSSSQDSTNEKVPF